MSTYRLFSALPWYDNKNEQVPKAGIIVHHNTTKLVICSTAEPVIQLSLVSMA